MSEDNKQEEVKTPDAQEKSVVGAVVGAVAYTVAAEATRSGIRWLRDHKEDIRNFFNRNNEQVAENSATNNTAEQSLQNNHDAQVNNLGNTEIVINNGQEGEENHQDIENMIVVPRGKEKFVQMLAKQADFSHLNSENIASKGENVEDNVEEKGVRENLIRWGRVIVPVVATAVLRYALGEEFDLGNDNQGEVENNNVAEAIQENAGNVVESVEPPTLTAEQRQELIEQLSREDAQEFTRAQGEQLHNNIRQIQNYMEGYGELNDRYDELYDRYDKEREAFLQECGYRDALNELSVLKQECRIGSILEK
ncbi:MAG: hypothetical protein IJZ30_05445 [Alphaproteobacteria bacterium]|nr:hypothetical protein [Alphaproteobacteria bacterium]